MPDIFIDASGTAGRRTNQQDSIWFCLAAITTSDTHATEDINKIFNHYKTLLPKGQKEFKSTKSESLNKKLLLELLSVRAWSYLAVAACKPRLRDALQRPAECQRWFVKMALRLKLQALKTGSIYIDKTGSHLEDTNLINALKADEQLNKYHAIRTSGCYESHHVFGIQLADLIAGQVSDHLNGHSEYDIELYKKIRIRESVVWTYPEDSMEFDNEALANIPLTAQSKLDFYSSKT